MALPGRRDVARDPDAGITLLYVGYTNCDDICPTHMAMIARALDELPPEVRTRVRVIFITADPERDTPATLREWLDRFDASFIGLTGDPEAPCEGPGGARHEPGGCRPACRRGL